MKKKNYKRVWCGSHTLLTYGTKYIVDSDDIPAHFALLRELKTKPTRQRRLEIFGLLKAQKQMIY